MPMTPPTPLVWAETVKLYPGVDISVCYDSVECQAKITVQWMLVKNGVSYTFEHSAWVSDEYIRRTSETTEQVFNNKVKEVCEEIVASLPEELVGKYPFTRIYHDLHLLKAEDGRAYPRGPNDQLFGHPERRVEGWIHNRFRHQKLYPKDGSITPVSLTINGESVGEDLKPKSKKVTIADSVVRQNQKLLEEAMTKTVVRKKKTPTAVRPLVDPTKVKKPECSLHGVKMQFDPAEAKWRCPTPGCTLVKRPKRDSDDKHVVLGKGNVELRYVQVEDECRLILISDDNVALDITKFVDVDSLLESSDLINQVKEADEAGVFNFVIEVPQEFDMKMKVVVMGVPDIVKNFEFSDKGGASDE